MKDYEVIEANFDRVANAMVEDYRAVLESYGRIQYKLYIWEDGDLESLEQFQGDNSYLVPNRCESRDLFLVDTIDAPFYDPWDFTCDSRPEDEEEAARMEAEINDCMVSEYEAAVADRLRLIIEQCKEEAELCY